MPSLKNNIVANLLGRIWSAALTLLLVPFYIKSLGIEAYGLIGFYTTLLASLVILDLGLSTTLNRELARAKAINKNPQEVRNLVFTLECIYWGVGFLLAMLVVLFAPWIAHNWINVETINVDTVTTSIRLMGAVIAFQWPISIYNGGLLGLEKQVLYNGVMIVMSTLRAAGVLLLFRFVPPSLPVFFIWQACLSALYVLTMRVALWRQLPAANASLHFSKDELKSIWRFASGMTGVGITAFLLAQIDKVILSKILPLTYYGYYTIAVTLTSALGTLVGPVYTAAFPRFSAMTSKVETVELKKTYHTVCKLVATIIFPLGLFIIFFAPQILLVWTKNEATVLHSYVLVQILAVANIFSCLVSVPAILVQAHGNARFIFLQNLVGCIVLVPLLFYLTHIYGALGATFVLLLLNTGYFLISVPLINKRYLKGESVRWYWDDTLLPMVAPLILLSVIKLMLHYYFSDTGLNLFTIGTIAFLAMFASIVCHAQMRRWLLQFINLSQQEKIIV